VERWLVCCAAALAALAACDRRPEASRPLVVASVRQPATALLFLAGPAGCFTAERLAIEERPHDLGRDALGSLREGSADVAVAYETPLARAALADGRLRVLTRLHTSTRNTRVVARGAAGIGGFSDLAGKRLAFARGTNADFFAVLALGIGGVSPGSATLVDLPPPRSVAALARGEVDAAVLSDPFAAEAEEALGQGARTLRTPLYAEASLLITREDVVASRRGQLVALLRALACAERRAGEDPARARALVAGRFPELTPPRLEAQLARVTWGLGLDNVLVDVLSREWDWLSASAGGAAPMGRLLEPALLEEVEPESVTLLPAAGDLAW